MRIRKLHFKNINNLKGEFTIDFDAEPLGSAGIFAITGPTGSGKSTILDVITLALFNEIARFKKVSVSEIEKLGSIITLNTHEAFANVEYEVKGNIYISKWSIRRSKTKTKKLQDYTMFLYDQSGNVLNQLKSEVPKLNQELIGLKYDQFLKSIILSQGQFAKFLKADKNERGLLLENITGTAIYRQIGIAAFEKEKEVKAQVRIEEEKLGGITIMDDAMTEHIIQQVVDSKEQLIQFQKKNDEYKLWHETLKNLNKLKEEFAFNQKEIKNLDTRESSLADQKEKFKIYESIQPLRADLALIETSKKMVLDLNQNKVAAEKELHEAKTAFQTTIEEMSALTKQKITEENFKVEMGSFEKEVNNLDRDLHNLTINGKDLRTEILKRQSQTKISFDQNIQPSVALSQLSEINKGISAELKKSKLKTDDDQAEVFLALSKSKTRLGLIKELKLCYDQLYEAAEKLKRKETESKKLSDSLDKEIPLAEKAVELIALRKEKLELLRNEKQNQILIAKLEEHRENLTDGSPCPLCGSTSHPFSEHLPEKDKDQIDAKIELAQKELAKAEKEANQLSVNISATQSSLKALIEQQKEHQSQQTQLQKKIQETQQELSMNGSVTAENIGELASKLSGEIEIKERGLEALSEFKVNKEIEKIYQKLNETLENYKAVHKKRHNKFEGENVSKVCNSLQDKFESSKTTITTLNTKLEENEKTKTQAENQYRVLSQKLLPRIRALGFPTIDELEPFMMGEEEASVLKTQFDSINQRRTELITEQNGFKTRILKLQEVPIPDGMEVDVLGVEIKNIENKTIEINRRIGEFNSAISRDKEERKKLKEKEKELNKLKKELDKWSMLARFIGDAKGNKFANFAQGLSLQNLLVFANKRLENLSDRYLLDKPYDEGSLNIIDRYQGNTPRSVSTLSGGESFLVSLALALGLSDIASRNVRLDCLFIDEGFGTLDPETLNSAMTTLENLQNDSKKTIGLISHVQELKNRIGVQIQLVKKGSGYSDIVVV